MGYSHSDVNKNIGSASIMGGYVYRGSTDPCLYGRYHQSCVDSELISYSTDQFLKLNSWDVSVNLFYFQVFVCWPVCFGHVDRHRDPWEQWELHLHSDPLQLLQELSDTLWHRCWKFSPVTWLHILVWWGQQQGHLCVGQQRRVPSCEAQPLQLYLSDRETWDEQRDSTSWSFIQGVDDRIEQPDGNAFVIYQYICFGFVSKIGSCCTESSRAGSQGELNDQYWYGAYVIRKRSQ